MTGTATRMFSAKPTFTSAGPWARIACNGEAVSEHGVVPDLLQLGVREAQPRRATQVNGLPADLHVDPLVAGLHERGELVDREEVLDPIAELLGDVPGVVGERLRRLLRLPAAVLVLECLGQIPVVQRRERLDARGEQLVDEAAVEVDAFRVGLPGCRRGRSEAMRSRSGMRWRRASSSAQRLPRTGGSGRWRRRRCRRS